MRGAKPSSWRRVLYEQNSRASAARVVKNTSVLAVPEVKAAPLAQRLQASLYRTFLRAAPFPANTAFDLQARKSTAIFLLPIYEDNRGYGFLY